LIDDDYHHLLTFKDIIDENGTVVKKAMDDVKALFALFAMAIFGNVFDKRTYMPFVHSVNDPSPKERQEQRDSDINAISLLERRHYAYTRGLAFDLIFWFLNRYGFSKPMEEPGVTYGNLAVPFTAELALHMVEYKWEAQDCEVPGAGTRDDFIDQVEMAVFGYEEMEEAYQSMEERNPSFAFDFADYELTVYDTPRVLYEPVTDFFEFGLTLADQKYFAALEGQS
jgi:hypothetical protein